MTSATKPKPAELKLIIEAAGGQVVDKLPAKLPADAPPLVIVSTEEEKRAWAGLKAKHKAAVALLRADKLLSCVLQQTLDLGAHNLLA